MGEKFEMGGREEVFVRGWEKKEFGIKFEKRLGIDWYEESLILFNWVIRGRRLVVGDLDCLNESIR